MTHVLMLLQQCAYARVLWECHRRREAQAARGERSNFGADGCGGDGSGEGTADALLARVRACDARWERMRRQLGADDLARARVARALYLQALLRSAPARLGGWRAVGGMDGMPASHLLEWVAHDMERMELADLEDSMDAQEAALYACALDRHA